MAKKKEESVVVMSEDLQKSLESLQAFKARKFQPTTNV